MKKDKTAITFEELENIVKEYMSKEEIKEIKNAYDFALELHKDEVRLSGNPYIYHLLNTVKDMGFDYIQQKTGINPNDYYNVAKTVVNNTPTQNTQYFTDVAQKTLTDTYNRYKNKVNNPPKPGQKGPTKKEQLKTFMND